jgi:hypothetical protein
MLIAEIEVIVKSDGFSLNSDYAEYHTKDRNFQLGLGRFVISPNNNYTAKLSIHALECAPPTGTVFLYTNGRLTYEIRYKYDSDKKQYGVAATHLHDGISTTPRKP